MSVRIVAVILAIVAMLAGGWKCYVAGRSDGRAEVAQMWDQERAKTAKAHADEQARARAREQTLQRQADQDRQEKHREIARLTRQRDAAIDSLRQRPDRPADAPSQAAAPAQPGPSAQGCTGGQLYRPDAAFLVGEAARADLIRAELAQCQAQYQAAERAMNGDQ